MRNRALLLFLLLLAGLMQEALGAVVRVADGDCAALSAASAAQPGSEPALIVLATRGHYGFCQITISGNISIDGAGATIALHSNGGLATDASIAQLQVQAGGSLTIRDTNFAGLATQPALGPKVSVAAVPPNAPRQVFVSGPLIRNSGSLVLDRVSLIGLVYSDTGFLDPSAMIINSGSLVFRNVTFVGNSLGGFPMLASTGPIDIVHSTFALNESSTGGLLATGSGGAVRVANSILSNTGSVICAAGPTPAGTVISLGGNVASDSSCALDSAGDRIVADTGIGTFGDNGGLVNTVVLNGGSAAVHNGIAANCEGADARGTARNVAARGGCDAGAYELGGGRGLLSQGGMSGFFFDASADGHYVTVQRLDIGSALVIWNTFDKNGQAAWIYSIGSVDGNHVHAQGAQNLGGVLQPGGAPTGSHGFVWGDIDIDFTDCLNGSFSYNSPLPNFGAGRFPLNRLAFLGDLDCSK
jgi:hypothetical protein